MWATNAATSPMMRLTVLLPRARLRVRPFAMVVERLELSAVRSQIDLALRKPHIVVVALQVPFARIADQRDHRTFFACGSHVGDELERPPEVGSARRPGAFGRQLVEEHHRGI